jgi:hypothetical protein
LVGQQAMTGPVRRTMGVSGRRPRSSKPSARSTRWVANSRDAVSIQGDYLGEFGAGFGDLAFAGAFDAGLGELAPDVPDRAACGVGGGGDGRAGLVGEADAVGVEVGEGGTRLGTPCHLVGEASQHHVERAALHADVGGEVELGEEALVAGAGGAEEGAGGKGDGPVARLEGDGDLCLVRGAPGERDGVGVDQAGSGGVGEGVEQAGQVEDGLVELVDIDAGGGGGRRRAGFRCGRASAGR